MEESEKADAPDRFDTGCGYSNPGEAIKELTEGAGMAMTSQHICYLEGR